MGNIFDNHNQIKKVHETARHEAKGGAKAVGLFGSRERKEHTAGVSDIDIMVVKEGISPQGEYDFSDSEVHIVRTPPNIEGDSENAEALRDMQKGTRWFWQKR